MTHNYVRIYSTCSTVTVPVQQSNLRSYLTLTEVGVQGDSSSQQMVFECLAKESSGHALQTHETEIFPATVRSVHTYIDIQCAFYYLWFGTQCLTSYIQLLTQLANSHNSGICCLCSCSNCMILNLTQLQCEVKHVVAVASQLKLCDNQLVSQYILASLQLYNLKCCITSCINYASYILQY